MAERPERTDDMLPEYDFTEAEVGKYVERYAAMLRKVEAETPRRADAGDLEIDDSPR